MNEQSSSLSSSDLFESNHEQSNQFNQPLLDFQFVLSSKNTDESTSNSHLSGFNNDLRSSLKFNNENGIEIEVPEVAATAISAIRFEQLGGSSDTEMEQEDFEVGGEDSSQMVVLRHSQNGKQKTKSNGKHKITTLKRVELSTEEPASSEDFSQMRQVRCLEYRYNYKDNEVPRNLDPLATMYFITGNVCIVNVLMEKEDFNRFSELNFYKSPVKTRTNHRSGNLEITLSNKQQALKDFTFLIEKMRTYSSQEFYRASLLLEKYQHTINEMERKKEILADESIRKRYEDYFDESSDRFEEVVQKKLDEISSTYPFYLYQVSNMNVFNFEMEMTKFGYSEALLALLGLDFQSAQHYLWRRGLFNLGDHRSNETLLFSLISHKLGIDEPYKISTSLRTFDNIEVYATAQSHIQMNRDTMNPFLPYNEILFIITFEISPNMIKQVMEIRKLTRENSMKYIRDIEEDLQYSMEAQMFLEKYYTSTVDDGINSKKKRAGFREIQRPAVP